MKRFLLKLIFTASIGICGTALPTAAQRIIPPNKAVDGEFAKFEKLVWKHFQSQADFRPTDLIAREDVEPLIKQLSTAGLALKKPDDLLKLLLSKNDFLYVELNTNAGRKFMRRIAAYQDGYDRLDRLSRMPRGKQTVSDLIRGPGGEKMIEYMTSAAGGKELGKQLSQAPNGADFNAPTGRIYTARDLLDYLKKQYGSQQKPEKR
ncbi:MAG: hypothetical protein IT426_17840 [Pirellulales bacterium]|nr:hypothetical protein [Pirellulales bacterium]